MNDVAVLIGDAERERAIALLHEACVDGRLTLQEFSDRMDLALTSRTRQDLEPVTAGLAAVPTITHAPSAAPPQPVRPPRRSVVSRLVAVMAENKQRGRWRVSEQSTAIAVMGNCEVDLRNAELPGTEITVTAIAVMGEVKVLVPEGIEVEVTGWAVMGSKEDKTSDAPLLPGAPYIRVHACTVMGSVKVEHRHSDETKALGGGR